MNCQEVQNQLSEYVDKSLDAIRLKGVETHLLSCVLCRNEAEGLAECVSQIQDLPAVEPPPGFAQRVMAHAREIDVNPTLWQRLISGVKLSMPIQASAVVLVAVLAVLLYRQEPAFQSTDPAEVTASPAVSPAAKTVDSPPMADRVQSSAKASEPAIKSRESVSQSSAPPAKMERADGVTDVIQRSRQARQPAANTKTEKVFGDAGEAPRRPPIQAQEIATGRESFRPSADAFGASGGIGNLEQQLFHAPFTAERRLSPLNEPPTDIEFVVRRRSPGPNDQGADAARDALSKRAEVENAMPATRPAIPQMGSIVEIRWFRVPADRYEQFKNELAAEATVESEKSFVAKAEKELAVQSARDLVVKVIILSTPGR